MKRRILTIGGLSLAAALAAAPAWALWTSAADGGAAAKSANMPTGGTPTASSSGVASPTISVSWPVANYVGPTPPVAVPSYIVKRYKAGVADTTALSAGCGGASGIVSATSCTDTVTADGVYTYTVTPLKQVTPSSGNWVGTESSLSNSVTYTAVTAPVAPVVSSVELVNGDPTNGAGLLRQGDSVRMTFDKSLKPSSICSAWTDALPTAASTQTTSGNNQVEITITPGDVLTVTNSACGGLAMGSFALGGDYNTSSGNIRYRSNSSNGGVPSQLSWNPTAMTLTVTLGTLRDGTELATTVAQNTLTWTAVGTIGTDALGNAVSTTTKTGLNQRF